MKKKSRVVDDAASQGVKPDLYETIFKNTPFFYFLINQDVKVELTNYFLLNPKASVPDVNIIGNVLNCRNACDSGCCGTSQFCKSCMIRASIVRSFEQKKNFTDLEAGMTLCDKHGMPYDIDVSVSGTLFSYSDTLKMLIYVRDITLYKSVQRRLLSLEYQGNFMKRKAGIVQRLARAANEAEFKEELLKLLHYKGDLQERMKNLRDSLDIDSYSLLPSIEVVCHDDGQFALLKRYLNNKYQIYRGKSVEEEIVTFLNARIDIILITADVDFQEANLLVSAIRSTNQDVPVLRLLNVGDSVAGNYTKIIYNPLTPAALDEVLKNLQIEHEMVIK